ncbi:hypothetical protein B5V89_15590, partial [Heyndrickxia sporothermodurans]
KVTYAGYGQQQTFEVPKTEVSIDDLFNGDNYYAEQIKLEYDAWKELNPDQDFSQKEYQLAAVNTHAFEYDSIRNQQESKEFWGQIAALVVIVGVSLVCPPAGIALGAAYGTFELSSAVSGKDWISGRELGTGERVFRGLLSPLDIIPGVSSITKFSGAVKLAHLGDMGQFAVKTGIKSSIKDGVTHIGNMVETAGKVSATRLKSAASAIKDGGTAIKNKVVEDTKDIGKLVGTEINNMTNIIPSRKLGLAADGMGDVGHAHIPVDEARVVGNEKGDVVSRIDGGSVGGGKGTGKVESTLDAKLKKYVCDSFEGTGKEVQDNFNKYLRENVWCDETLSNSEKIEIMRENFNRLTSEQKIDFNVLNDEKFLTHNSDYTNWGDWPPVNWPEFPGLDKTQSIISISKENTIPEKLDRIGSLYGNNFATIPESGIKHTMDERAICYIDNPAAYHKYTFESTYYFDCIDCIKNKDVDGLNKIIDEMNFKNKDSHIERIDENDMIDWNLQYNKFQNNSLLKALCEEKGLDSTYGLLGKAAPWYDEGKNNLLANGGAGQLNTPVSGNVLKYLRILREE